jgi:DNA-binding winged helix-turn-helix (wHTH) protein/tetratricopeptide (TPR) repeat protein
MRCVCPHLAAYHALIYARHMPSHYTLLDLHIDVDAKRVERAGDALDITGLSFDLLAYLLARGTAVVTFDELLAAVWAPAVVNEDTVTQRVRLLRHALGDSGRRPRYIRSVRGRGYQLLAKPQAWAPDATAATSTVAAAADESYTERDGPQVERAPSESAPSPSMRSPTRATSFASRKMAIRLISARTWKLFPVPALAALALIAATFTFWPDARHAAWTNSGNTSAPGSELLTRARYYASIGQRDNNERAIALYTQALNQTPNLTRATLGLSFAYSARVCHYGFEPQWAERAESLARDVLRTEPQSALAFTALAMAEDCRGQIDAAITHYERAVQLDSAGSRDSLASVANLYQVKGRLADALRSNLTVSQTGAPSRFLEIQIAHTLELLGFTSAAERRYSHTFQLYPDNVFANVAWPQFLMAHNRLTEAGAALNEALARGTDRNDLQMLAGELALLRGDRRAAMQAFERASAMRRGNSFPETLALVYAPAPPPPAVLRARIAASKQCIAAGDRWPQNWLEIAVLQTALGDSPAAIESLNQAVEVGFLDKAYLQTSPLFRPLSSQPGFARVIDTITARVEQQRQLVMSSGWAPREITLAMAAP